MRPTHILTDPDPDPTTRPTGGDTLNGNLDGTKVTSGHAAAAAARAAKTWLRLSAAFSEQVPTLAERADVTVTIAPDLGRGAPGCFIPALATIELDAATLTSSGIDPATCHPHRPSDRERYAPMWGVFIHECAHARHSTWTTSTPTRTRPATAIAPSDTGAAAGAVASEDAASSVHHGADDGRPDTTPALDPPAAPDLAGTPVASRPFPGNLPGSTAMAAAMLLEESRIEAAHLARRPGDRHWLRAATNALIMPEITTTEATTAADTTTDSPDETVETDGTGGPDVSGGPGALGGTDEPVAGPRREPPPTDATPATTAPTGPDPTMPDPTMPDPTMRGRSVDEPASDGSARVREASEVEVWTAAQAAGLLLARVDAGVLDATETEQLKEMLTKILGADRLHQLQIVWRAAQATDDDDAAAMIILGHVWCLVLGIDPTSPTPTPQRDLDGSSDDQAQDRDGDGPAPVGTHRPTPADLVAAIEAALVAVRVADDPTLPPRPASGPPPISKAKARTIEARARLAADLAASAVFDTSSGDHQPDATSLAGARPPTQAEASAARRLARALREAGTRDRVSTATRSPTPPGRLSVRGALAADAQRAAGASVTAEPFTRTSRRHVPTPPLRVGIACDVSGSMADAAPVVASTAWVLARAVAHVPDARAATVIYGEHVRPVTRPGQTPTQVTEFHAWDGFEQFTRAVDALDAVLDLTRPGAARLLVNVSDGHYTSSERATGTKRISRLRAHGCGVLWIALDHSAHPIPGTRLLVLTDPATIGEAIARAVISTLQHA